jgi:hypothetical protein
MVSQEIIDLVFQYGPIIATIVITWLVKGWKDWAEVKLKLVEINEFLTTVNDALYDDKVTEDEFRNVFDKFKKLIRYKWVD